MSLECGECETDLRGGHHPRCSRHPINKKKHPCHKAVKLIRDSFRPDDDHHPNCESRKVGECDCYAKGNDELHQALDHLVYALDREDCDE